MSRLKNSCGPTAYMRSAISIIKMGRKNHSVVSKSNAIHTALARIKRSKIQTNILQIIQTYPRRSKKSRVKTTYWCSTTLTSAWLTRDENMFGQHRAKMLSSVLSVTSRMFSKSDTFAKFFLVTPIVVSFCRIVYHTTAVWEVKEPRCTIYTSRTELDIYPPTFSSVILYCREFNSAIHFSKVTMGSVSALSTLIRSNDVLTLRIFSFKATMISFYRVYFTGDMNVKPRCQNFKSHAVTRPILRVGL